MDRQEWRTLWADERSTLCRCTWAGATGQADVPPLRRTTSAQSPPHSDGTQYALPTATMPYVAKPTHRRGCAPVAAHDLID